MKKLVIILGAFVLSTVLLSLNRISESTVKELPSVGIQTKFESKLASIESFGNEFHETIESGSRAVIIAQFLQLRLKFKELEFLIAYTDPQLFNLNLNGAPLPKLMEKVPDLTIIEPKGLQRMEEVIYEDDFDRAEVLRLFEKFQYSMDQFTQSVSRRQLTDAELFEAIRFGLVRLNILNVTGFDAPANSDKVNAECIAIIKGMKWVMEDYAAFVKSSKVEEINTIFDTGIEQLNSQSFENFDHLTFLTDVINPLWKSTLELQRELNIELPSQRDNNPRYINYEAENLFGADFLNAATFGEFREGEDLTEQIRLGKKLFFDPILSHNNSMACASCHNPQKAFTDGEKTSLTSAGLPGKRNAPTLINAVFATKYFHDVRTDRLSLQMDHVVYNA
jgi:cytochrome c peroxidase